MLLCESRCCSMSECVELSPSLFVPGCLGQELCYSTASLCEKLSMWLLRRFSCRVFRCLCILYLLTAVSFLCSVSKATPHWVESWGEMSRALRLFRDASFGLQSSSLMMWLHLAISCRVQSLHLQLIVCQRLQTVFSSLHRFEDRSGLPVSFPEGMVSGRPRNRLSLLIFVLSECCKKSLSWRRGCVHGV